MHRHYYGNDLEKNKTVQIFKCFLVLFQSFVGIDILVASTTLFIACRQCLGEEGE